MSPGKHGGGTVLELLGANDLVPPAKVTLLIGSSIVMFDRM